MEIIYAPCKNTLLYIGYLKDLQKCNFVILHIEYNVNTNMILHQKTMWESLDFIIIIQGIY